MAPSIVFCINNAFRNFSSDVCDHYGALIKQKIEALYPSADVLVEWEYIPSGHDTSLNYSLISVDGDLIREAAEGVMRQAA